MIGLDRNLITKSKLNRALISNSMQISEDEKPYGKENIRENYN